MFWSLCWAYAGQTFVILSLAEMASMAPTAGGQYHWVSEFAPPEHQKLLSYISGWLSTISWQSIIAIDSYIVGVMIQGMIVLNNPKYVRTGWQGTLFIWAAVIGIALFNVFAAKRLPLAEGIFVSVHVFAFFPVIIILWVFAPKQSAAEVFTVFTNSAGWPSTALAVMVGQVSTMFVVLGSDSVAHMSEEIQGAATIVPRSMVWSFVLNIPMTFGLLITYLFCIGNLEEAIASPTGFPFIYVFQNALGTTGGATALTAVILLLIVMITISSLASTSRQTFAFARDNGLPFSNWLAQVHPKWHIPVNSIIFTCVFTMAISLINIGSTVAFNAMLSLSTTALMGTYVISIGCVTWGRYKKRQFPHAQWSLGKYGLTINVIALCYATWSFFWSFWPNSAAVTPQNFNWACVLFLGILGGASVLYFFHARKVYDGPVVKVQRVLQ